MSVLMFRSASEKKNVMVQKMVVEVKVSWHTRATPPVDPGP
jgi:hypothetical protein